MNIDKIKNYNQKLLAMLGTVILLIAILGLVAFAIAVVADLKNSYWDDNRSGGLLADDKVQELQKQNKRKQLISYSSPKLVDTLKSIYVIPVLHKTLEKAEEIDSRIEDLLDTDRRAHMKVSKEYGGSYGVGPFNNILVYNEANAQIEKLFEQRVHFRRYRIEYFEDDIFLVIKAAEKDTYKDGLVDMDDLTSMYLYSFKEKRLVKIGLESGTISDYDFVNNSKDMLIRFGMDYNKDGKFEEYREPASIRKYVFETDTLIKVINENLSRDLQRSLEGSGN